MNPIAVKVITYASITVGTLFLAIFLARAIYFHCEHCSQKRTEGKEER